LKNDGRLPLFVVIECINLNDPETYVLISFMSTNPYIETEGQTIEAMPQYFRFERCIKTCEVLDHYV
jgi:hypothetical protein